MKRFIVPISAVCVASLLLGLMATNGFAQTATAFGNLPLSFEAGQSGQFVAHGRDSQFSISATGAQLTLRPTATEAAHTVGMQFVGAATATGIQGRDELSGKVNYLVGNNPAQWRLAVPTFARVQLSDIYPGINVVYYGNQRQLEYDFNLAAGVSPEAVAVRFSGTDKISLDAQGGLVLAVGHQTIRQPRPVIYQTVNHERQEIAGGYRIVDAHTVAFAVGPHDPSLPLVIDPILSYSSYFGGNSGDTAWAVAVDTNGFVYVAGSTFSTQKANSAPFIPTPGAFQTNFAGGSVTGDAFVAKFGAAGTNLIYLTYLGGSADDGALGLAVDTAGDAFVTGYTDSTNFPTSANAAFPKISGVYSSTFGYYPVDAFVTEISSSGSNLIYSTYLGGNSSDAAFGIAVDAAGAAYVTGVTYSTNFPTVNAVQNHLACVNSFYYNANAFVTEVAPGGGSLVFSTYLGGTNFDQGQGIAVDASGVYVTGFTASTNFPTTHYIVQTIGTNSYNGSLLNAQTNYANYALADDAFVTKYAPGGGSLIYSTLLGGSNYDCGYQIAVDASGNAYVAGATISPGFPNTATNVPGLSSYLATNTAAVLVTNAFLTQITWNGTNAGIGYSAMFGGDGNDAAYALAVDPAGNAFVVGTASSLNFPTINTNGALVNYNSGGSDAFITAVNPSGTAVFYSAYLGGNGNDIAYGVALDAQDDAFIVGQTTSTTFPTVNPLQPHLNGASDTFLSEVVSFPGLPVITSQPTNQNIAVGSSASFSVTVTGIPPFSYQWQLDGTNLHNGTYITGVTNSTLTINNAQTTNSGNYTVLIMNDVVPVTSSNAVLTVTNLATTLTQQPASQTVGIGSTVSFSVNGTAQSPFVLQWIKDTVNLTNNTTSSGSIISGATSSGLTISNVQTNDDGVYALVISNAWGVYTSSNAVLIVVAAPVITVPPTNQMVGLGSYVTFPVTAAGEGTLSYQWQFNGVNLTDDVTNINGSATAALTLNSAQIPNDGGYSVIVTNSFGSVTSSPPAVLTILTAPTFTGITSAGTNGGFVVSGAGGTNGGTYIVLASTNLATPVDQWSAINAYQFGSQGQFAFTNLPPAGFPQRFYLLKLPSP